MGRAILQLILMAFPWSLRRRLLQKTLGFVIHPTASIGYSVVLPAHLRMGEHSAIGHLNVMKGMDRVTLARFAVIGTMNWIYAIPRGAPHLHGQERDPELVLDEGASVVSRHLIDCSSAVHVGRFALLAGYSSQVISHAIDVRRNRQASRPITIGPYSFVGTGCVLLGGAKVPPYSVVGAGSTLRDAFTEPYKIYAGVPAVAVGTLPEDAAFFVRESAEVF